MARNERREVKRQTGRKSLDKARESEENIDHDQAEEKGEMVDFSKQHENLHKQIVAFEKLLQHAMNRFSRDKLFNMLKLLSKNMADKRQVEDGATVHVHSVEHLKSVIYEMRDSHVGKKLIRENEKLLVQYFTTYFEDLEYLNELKRYFDEKIYICLYEYFYDPLDDAIGTQFMVTSQGQVIEQESSTVKFKNENHDSNESNSDCEKRQEPKQAKASSKHSQQSQTNQEEEEEEIVFDFLSKQAKLSLAVQQMYKVNTKWDLILDESDPHLSAYDPDSKYELSAYSGSSRYEPILRLLPDMFVKAYKSIEMAKLWWGQAEKLYSGKAVKRRTVKELKKEEVEIEHKIEKISEDIKRFETTALVRSDDLLKISERESRFQALSGQCEKLEERKDSATQAYNAILAQVKSMEEELELYQKGSKKYTELEKRLKERDKQLALTKDELKILAYHFHIVQEDFNLEMELQPHLIRFRADIEGKMCELQDELRVKESQKRESEKRLILLKANCERMHEIMQRYNIMGNSRTSTPTREHTDHVIDEKSHPRVSHSSKDSKQTLTKRANQSTKVLLGTEKSYKVKQKTLSSDQKQGNAKQK